MYLAELHGKLPSRVERMEDILTSNVFSFFKYSRREIFLKEYLNLLGYSVSAKEAREAIFLFWTRYDDNTEPDLAIIVGQYYLLIEAKYFSGFSETSIKTEAQLLREIKGGELDAMNYRKNFQLIAITADHYYKEDKFKIIPSNFKSKFKWTNWQKITSFIYDKLDDNVPITSHEREFASDLYNLLDRKNLRDFQCIQNIYKNTSYLKKVENVFFQARTAKFRGDFIGFYNVLFSEMKLNLIRHSIFFKEKKHVK